MPPPGCKNEAVKELVRRVNEAADALEDWEEKAGGATKQRRLAVAASTARWRRQNTTIGRRPTRVTIGD